VLHETPVSRKETDFTQRRKDGAKAAKKNWKNLLGIFFAFFASFFAPLREK